MSKQSFEKFLCFFLLYGPFRGLGALIIHFAHFSKIIIKQLKFGTDKQHIKANIHAKFCMNSINVQDVIENYLRENY